MKEKFPSGVNTLRLMTMGGGTRDEAEGGCWGVSRSESNTQIFLRVPTVRRQYPPQRSNFNFPPDLLGYSLPMQCYTQPTIERAFFRVA